MKKKLNRMLATGDPIELKVTEKNTPIVAIESTLDSLLEDAKVVVRTKHSADAIRIEKHGTIQVSIKNQQTGVLELEATVAHITPRNDELILELHLNAEISHIQRREYFRLPMYKEFEIGLPGDQPNLALLQNISAGGLKCLVPEPIRQGATINLVLNLDQYELDLKGKVLECVSTSTNQVYTSPHTVIRVQFTHISHKDQQKLLNYLFHEQAKRESKIQRK